MKICLVISGLGMGGAEKMVCDLADSFINKQHEVLLIYLSKDQPVVLPKNKKVKIESLNISSKNKLSVLVGMRKYRKLLSIFQPDVVNSHMIHSNIFCRVMRLFKKVPKLICTAHNTNEGGKLRMLMYRYTDFLADMSTNVSQEAVDTFIKLKATKPDKMRVIHNGINTDQFVFKPEARKKRRVQLEISDTEILLMAIGRLTEAKDYPNLFNALALLQEKQIRPKLAIIGAGELEHELKNIAITLGINNQIYWLGLQQNIEEWLAASDVFVLSSAWEGFGLVVAEAMSCERVVLGTNSGGVMEVIGDTGFLVPTENSYELANRLLHIIALSSAEKADIGIEARQRVKKHYSLDRCSQNYLSVYVTQ